MLVLCYLPFLIGSKDFVIRDCEFLYQPECHFIGECLRKGIFPLWNPHDYCGFPQVAVSSPGLFYPLNYLLFLLPFSQGEALYLLLQQFLSGLAAFLLVDRLLKNKGAAVFASLSMMFCGYMFAMYKYPDFVASVCALLFCFWASAGFFREGAHKQKAYFSALCFFAFMLFVSGRPEIFLPGSFLLLLQAAGEIWRLRKSGLPMIKLLELFAFWSLALALRLLLACPMIVPSWNGRRLSPRAHGLNAEEAFQVEHLLV